MQRARAAGSSEKNPTQSPPTHPPKNPKTQIKQTNKKPKRLIVPMWKVMTSFGMWLLLSTVLGFFFLGGTFFSEKSGLLQN